MESVPEYSRLSSSTVEELGNMNPLFVQFLAWQRLVHLNLEKKVNKDLPISLSFYRPPDTNNLSSSSSSLNHPNKVIPSDLPRRKNYSGEGKKRGEHLDSLSSSNPNTPYSSSDGRSKTRKSERIQKSKKVVAPPTSLLDQSDSNPKPNTVVDLVNNDNVLGSSTPINLSNNGNSLISNSTPLSLVRDYNKSVPNNNFSNPNLSLLPNNNAPPNSNPLLLNNPNLSSGVTITISPLSNPPNTSNNLNPNSQHIFSQNLLNNFPQIPNSKKRPIDSSNPNPNSPTLNNIPVQQQKPNKKNKKDNVIARLEMKDSGNFFVIFHT